MLSAEEATRDSRVEGSSGSAIDTLQDVAAGQHAADMYVRSCERLNSG